MFFYKGLTYYTTLLISIVVLCYNSQAQNKINGVNLVSPQYTMPPHLSDLQKIRPNWVSVCPVIMLESNNPRILFPSVSNYQGDSPENILSLCQQAHKEGYKVLLKPIFRVDSIDWAGDFILNGYLQNTFEDQFTALMMNFAKIAQTEGVEMYCLGTELKTFIAQRPSYWNQLIHDIRQAYDGKLSYAANWDNVKNIPFWNSLDYIGVDAYYPLSEQATPELSQLLHAWQGPYRELQKLSRRHNKPIIFTEFGYRSIDRATWKQWEFEHEDASKLINLSAQTIGYEALFQTFWEEDWFAGGFVWKWFIDNPKAGGEQNSDYTPQNKPVTSTIKRWYSQEKY